MSTLTDARCRDGNPDDWHSTDFKTQLSARQVCITCPVIRACAQAALAEPELYGVWASIPNSGNNSKKAGYRARLQRIADGEPAPDPAPASTRARLDRIACHYLAGRGMSGKEIARHLGITTSKVSRHLKEVAA